MVLPLILGQLAHFEVHSLRNGVDLYFPLCQPSGKNMKKMKMKISRFKGSVKCLEVRLEGHPENNP